MEPHRTREQSHRVARAAGALSEAVHPNALVDESFVPPAWLRSGHAQSILPSLPWRRPAVLARARPMREASSALLIECGDDVSLQAFVARPAAGTDNGRTVVLLHGWEGSAESLYVLSLAQHLFERGYEVVRLNLRDHGATHHLNRGLFHSCLLPEVVGAIRRIQAARPARALDLVGFSLGGNFMLRVAAQADEAGLGIAHAVAVSPVIDPARTLDSLENGLRIYHHYFVLKWNRSLAKKREAWPGHYDFAPLRGKRDLRYMTEVLVRAHTAYPSLGAYLDGYSIIGERLATLSARSTIIAALDDPIIPSADLARLAAPANLRIVLTRYGGHCGFLGKLTEPSWADVEVGKRLLGVDQPAEADSGLPIATRQRA